MEFRLFRKKAFQSCWACWSVFLICYFIYFAHNIFPFFCFVFFNMMPFEFFSFLFRNSWYSCILLHFVAFCCTKIWLANAMGQFYVLWYFSHVLLEDRESFRWIRHKMSKNNLYNFLERFLIGTTRYFGGVGETHAWFHRHIYPRMQILWNF